MILLISRVPLPSFRARSSPSSRRAMAASVKAAAAAKDVYALDFDGVMCDSVGESSLSAWKSAEKLWPDVFTSPAAVSRKAEVLDKMRAVRPVVETGYENVVQIRSLLDGVSVDEMLSTWHDLLPREMERLKLDRKELVKLFGGVRDDWIATDLKGWLAPNRNIRFYEGTVSPVIKALASKDHELYIVTTKQARFTEQLLTEMAGIPFPADRIYSQTESGEPKSARLEHIQAAQGEGARYHFVEDKLATLEKVAKVPSLAHWKLYLVDWGYNTKEERARAAENSRISIIGAKQFGRLLEGGPDLDL